MVVGDEGVLGKVSKKSKEHGRMTPGDHFDLELLKAFSQAARPQP